MSRIRLVFLVEGTAEENLVEKILSPHLGRLGVDCFATRVVTRKDRRAGIQHQGGGRSYDAIHCHLRNLCRQWQGKKDVWFTSAFDVYALPGDFPGRERAFESQDPYEKVELLETAWREHLKGVTQRFIPNLLLHEFESLLFVDLEALKLLLIEHDRAIDQLAASVARFEKGLHGRRWNGVTGIDWMRG